MSENIYDSTKFVGRTAENNTFDALVRAGKLPHLPVFCFYGVGGVGKSCLQARLQYALRNRIERSKSTDKPVNIPFAKINFGEETPADFPEFLRRIAHELDENGAKCPEFWVAWDYYDEKSNPSTQSSKVVRKGPRGVPWLSFVATMGFGAVISPAFKDKFQYSWPEMAAILTSSSGIVGLAVSAIVNKLEKINFFKTPLDKEYCDKSAEELRRALPQALANDLEQQARAHEDFQCGSVIFFDTLEIKDSETRDVPQIQKWIAQFAQLFPRCLVVLTGHNPVHWDEEPQFRDDWNWSNKTHFDPTYAKMPSWDASHSWRKFHLVQYRLLDLNRTNAEELLKHYEITDPALRDVILRECREESLRIQQQDEAATAHEGYHPASLMLCVETLKHEREKNGMWPSAQSFSLDKTKHETIIGRYLKSLSDEEWAMTKKLAFTPQFDLEAAATVCGVPPHSRIWKRNYMTKVSSTLPGEWRVFSSNMRHHILEAAPRTDAGNIHDRDAIDFNAQKTHEDWYAHWKLRYENRPDKARSPHEELEVSTNLFARLAWYHRYHLNPEAAWLQWRALAEPLRDSEDEQDQKNLVNLLKWWDMTDIRHRKPLDEVAANRVYLLSCFYWNCKINVPLTRHRRATECCDRALEFYERRRKEHQERWAFVQKRKGANYGKMDELTSLSQTERWRQLKQTIECYKLAADVFKATNSEEWMNTQLHQGLTQVKIGELNDIPELDETERWEQLKQAVKCFESAWKVRPKDKNLTQWATAQNNKGNAYFFMGQYTNVPDWNKAKRWEQFKNAIKCYKLAADIFQQEDLETWAEVQHNEGNAHFEISDLTDVPNLSEDASRAHLEQSLQCYKLALGVHTKDQYPQEWAGLQYKKALSEWKLNDFSAALDSIRNARKGFYLLGDQVRWQYTQMAYDAIQRKQPLT